MLAHPFAICLPCLIAAYDLEDRYKSIQHARSEAGSGDIAVRATISIADAGTEGYECFAHILLDTLV